MAVGYKLTIKTHESSAGAVVLDNVDIVECNFPAGFVGATTVVKENFTGSPNDAFMVQITALGTVTATQTLAQLQTLATNAVNNAFGNGEAGAPT